MTIASLHEGVNVHGVTGKNQLIFSCRREFVANLLWWGLVRSQHVYAHFLTFLCFTMNLIQIQLNISFYRSVAFISTHSLFAHRLFTSRIHRMSTHIAHVLSRAHTTMALSSSECSSCDIYVSYIAEYSHIRERGYSTLIYIMSMWLLRMTVSTRPLSIILILLLCLYLYEFI